MTNMQEQNLFSVLISVYFKEKPEYLLQCLFSIYSNTLIPAEVVLVEDGPLTQELYNVINFFQHKYGFKTVRLENNQGLGIALNIGLNECTYDIVARMDSDDICEPDRFAKQYNYMITHQDIHLIGGAIIEFSEDLKTKIGNRLVPCDYKDILNKCYIRNPFNHMTVMFRKKTIISVGGYQEHLLMEDYNLWLRLIASGAKVENLPDILVRVRAGQSMIARRSGMHYVISEYKLMQLVAKLKITSKTRAFSIFLLRAVLRCLPVNLLAKIYSYSRR